jgi:hypothetical protein
VYPIHRARRHINCPNGAETVTIYEFAALSGQDLVENEDCLNLNAVARVHRERGDRQQERSTTGADHELSVQSTQEKHR